MGDVSTTIEALKAADNRLRESGDTAAFKVRSQIAKEISAVKKVQVADVVGIYSQLEMLEEDVAKLGVWICWIDSFKRAELLAKRSLCKSLCSLSLR
jgi:uncharacterized protein HemX